MIELHEHHLIGKGRTRSCYLHPLDDQKCIKIDKRITGGPTDKEALYYAKIPRIRPHFSYVHIPRFYGFVETSLGRGGVFDLIRDEADGAISKSFSYYISIREVTLDDPRWLKAHADYMKILYDEAIIIRDFNPGNICVRKMLNGSYQFVSIDGIGHRQRIPLCDYSLWLSRLTLRRHVNRKGFASVAAMLQRLAVKKQTHRARRTP